MRRWSRTACGSSTGLRLAIHDRRAHGHRRPERRRQVDADQRPDRRRITRWRMRMACRRCASSASRSGICSRPAIAPGHRLRRPAPDVRPRPQRRQHQRRPTPCCRDFSRPWAWSIRGGSPARCGSGRRTRSNALGAAHLARKPLDEMSTGEARRVLIARALVPRARRAGARRADDRSRHGGPAAFPRNGEPRRPRGHDGHPRHPPRRRNHSRDRARDPVEAGPVALEGAKRDVLTSAHSLTHRLRRAGRAA